MTLFAEITTPSAWHGAVMAQHQTLWQQHFTPTDIAELEAAAEPLLATNHAIAHLNSADFKLPTLALKLQALRQQLTHGCGFALLRGLPLERYSQRQATVMFYGLGCHLGWPRSQNAQGHVLGHVRDLGLSSTDPDVRIYQTHERQTFHTDSADVVALLCLKTAQRGGQSLLVSAAAIYNTMRKHRPDLLDLLFQPIATDRRGEVPTGEQPFMLIPVFSAYQGYLTVFYQRQYIESAQRFAEAPRLTERHIEALDLFDALANDPQLHLTMDLLPGDMQFVHNHSLLHDRTAFTDWPEPQRKRHLLRLWLSVPDDRPLPPVFASRFGSVTVGDRGGIIVPGNQLSIPWDLT